MINSASTVSNPVSSVNRTFPIYTITPHTTRNNKPLSVINPNRTTYTHVHTHDDSNHRSHRYSLGYLIVCMLISCFIGLTAMQSYIINNQQITTTTDGYVSTIFGQDYLYR